MKVTIASLLLANLAAYTIAYAAVKDFTPNKTEVHFTAIGKPAMLKISGKTDDLKGKINIDGQKLNANLIVNLSSLVTGIDTRDTHMKEKYLEVAKFPSAELIIKDLQLPAAIENLQKPVADSDFTGELNLHGTKQTVNGKYSLEPQASGKVLVHAKYTLNLSDFKIEIPSYMGIKVADKVELDSNFEINK